MAQELFHDIDVVELIKVGAPFFVGVLGKTLAGKTFVTINAQKLIPAAQIVALRRFEQKALFFGLEEEIVPAVKIAKRCNKFGPSVPACLA